MIGAARASARTRKVGGLLVSALLASTACSAMAQSSGENPPPARASLDENGVNLATGEHLILSTPLSIGSGETLLALSTIRGWAGSGSNFSQSVRQVGSTWYATVPTELGSRSYKFTLTGGVYTSLTGEPATLVNVGGVYSLTTPDGTVFTYGNSTKEGAPLAQSSFRARLTKVTSPSGETIDLTYREATYCVVSNQDICQQNNYRTKVRLQSVRNSYGYQLHYSYDGNATEPATPTQGAKWDKLLGVTAFNLAVDYCAPDAVSCTFSRAWPSTSLAETIGSFTTTTTVQDSGGRTTTYIRDTPPSGFKYIVRRPGSTANDVEVTWDTLGRTTSVLSNGRMTTYAWTLSGNDLSVVITNPGGTTRTVVSDVSVGLPKSVTDELGHTTTMSYDSAGRLKTVIYPEQNKTTYTYDDVSSRGNLTEIRQTAKSPGNPADIVTTMHYPASCAGAAAKYCNKPDWVRDPLGQASLKQTDYSYHADSGNVATVTLPAVQIGEAQVRPQIRYSYTPLRAYFKTSASAITASPTTVYRLTQVSTCATTASCVGGADESRSVVSYGPQTAGVANNILPISTTSGSGAAFAGGLTAQLATSAFAYDATGNLVSADGPLPGADDTTTYRYNGSREIVGVIMPDPDGAGSRKRVAQKTTYDNRGFPTLTEIGTVNGTSDGDWLAFSSAQQAITDYDASGRKIRDVLNAGGATRAITHFSYNARGLLECTAVRMNPSVWAAQSANCTPDIAGPDGPDRIAHVAYDAVGRPQAVTEAYNVSGAQAVTQTTTYRPNGPVETVKDAENNLTTYEYDGHDRLFKTRYPISTKGAVSSSTTDFEQVGYDANGNITSRRVRSGQTLYYTYDALNRKTFDQNLGDHVAEAHATYSYDLLGRLTKAIDSNGWYSEYQYDGLGRVEKQASNLAPAGLKFQYDLAGRRTRQEWHDGFTVLYDYDSSGAMTGIREENGGFVLASFGYDDLGRRTTLSRGNGTTTSYTYDPASRLEALSHDLAGSAQDVTYSFGYNSASQIVTRSASNNAYSWTGYVAADRPYASNGLNQLTSSGGTVLSYDARGNLSQSGSDSYSYNSRNQMVSGPGVGLLYRNPIGLLNHLIRANNAGVTNFDRDGARVATEFGIDNHRYVYGPGVDEPLVWYAHMSTAQRRWFHADERGSIVAVSNASGAALAINTYDEFGIPGPNNLGRFGFTGQMWLPEVGLYDYKARMYSPTLGRFMQTDPIGYADGLNLYNYVGGDPVNFVDPTGLACEPAPAGQILVCGKRPPNPAPGGGGGKLSGNQLSGNTVLNECDASNKRPPKSCSARQKVDPKTIRQNQCRVAAVAKGFGNAALNAAGFIPGGAAAAVIARAGATSIQGTSAILGRDAAGGALTAGGFGTELVGAGLTSKQAASGFGLGLAKSLPVLGAAITVVSLAKDGLDAYQEYQDCSNVQ